MKITTEQALALNNPRQSFLADGMLLVLFLAFANFLLHLYFNNQYGYFRDEFDYMACGNHLAWGYVDQPPLVPFLIKISRLLLGDSLRSIRIIPALATSAAVILTAMIARDLGGRRFAVVLSAWFGVVAGIGLEEKYSIAVLGLSIVVGLLLTEQRRAFTRKWIWFGGALAFLVFLPNLLWNVQNHWPFVELMHNIKAEGRDVVLSPAAFFAQQVLIAHPVLAPIWITGVLAFLFSARLKPYRFLGWCYLAAFTVFVVLKGKNYYLAPIYPVFLAAGAVVIESFIARSRQVWLKPALVVLILAGGTWLAPVVMPVLPIDKFILYADHLPFKVPRSEHSHMRAILPQHFADEFGWEEIIAAVNQAYSRLSPEERAGCGIFAQNYGQAGAIDFFGGRNGLPPALSGHQTYFLWGPRSYSGNCLIVLDDSREVLEREFEHVEYVGKSSDNPYAMEREIPIFICRGAKFGSLAEIWPRLKRWR